MKLDKGKQREEVSASAKKKTTSQLKAGYTLVPLWSSTSSGSGERSKRRSQSPQKSVKEAKKSDKAAKSPSSAVKKKAAAVAVPVIEILDDSDEDVIPVQPASASKSKRIIVKTSSTTTAVKAVASSTAVATVASKAVVASKTIEIDLEEDENFLEPVQSTSKRPFDEERDDYSAFEDDIFDEDGDDGWMEESDGKLGANQDDAFAIDLDDFEEAPLAEDDDLGAEPRGGDGDSDDDILELMDRGDSAGPSSRPMKKRRISQIATPAGGSKSQLLRPLCSLRRSISPSTLSNSGSGPLDPSRPNAFTALMTGNGIDKKWADAAESEKAQWKRGWVRPAPFYKILEGMTIAVDAFKYGKIPNVDAYFLSHAHSDHYTNLSSSWTHGPIYCSVGTANLIKLKLGVKDEYLRPMQFDEVVEVAGIKVTCLDANHCPGSSIFLFEGPHTSPASKWHKTPSRIFRYLHCGDFRASPAHLLHPAMKGKKIDICYLDTTYLNPKYCFPAQEQVIDACAELIRCRVEGDRDALKKGSGGGAQLVRQGEMMKGWLSKAKKEEEEEMAEALVRSAANDGEYLETAGPVTGPSTGLVPIKDEKPVERLLVMVGTYSIGKERIVKGIAKAIGAKIYADKRKMEIFAAQNDPELMSMVTDNPYEGQIHVTWLGQIKVDELSDYLDKFKPHFTSIVGLRPTGWTFKPEGTLATSLKQPSVIQMLSRELQRSYNPSWMTPTKDSTRTVEAYGVPYSEHSSFAELTCFAVSMDVVRIIPTVNVGSKKSRQNMNGWIERWAQERKRRKAAGEPLMVPHRTMDYW